MAVIKCKMCGGDLNLIEGKTTAACEYCGSVQTVPVADDEKKLIQFERAERLRRQCEFDKAAGLYENIVADYRQEAEAYWGLVLCKYGIEYVDDPATGKKIPTCHRSSFDSIMDDGDFEQVMETADSVARRVYREEAKAIEELRKGIIAVSNNEEPYDIFICYKETAEDGQRTLDSVLAQDVYDALTDKGYRVFFSRISLEDKLGQEYEPYIFAALNSAKIMLAFGTDYDYYNAVWVKNEWSRFLKLMAKDKEKHLIPCFKGIDAYDMPKEFAKLQAQDLGKVGATQDLLRGIEKLLPKATAAPQEKVVVKEVVREIVREQVVVQAPNPNVEGQLQRGWDLLISRKWEEADAQFNKVLDLDGTNAKAYLGKLCAKYQYLVPEHLASDDDEILVTGKLPNGRTYKSKTPRRGSEIFKSPEYLRALEYADTALRVQLEGYHSKRKDLRNKRLYEQAVVLMKKREYAEAARSFGNLGEYRDAAQQAKECRRLMEADADVQTCQRLEKIRKRNAPVQQLMVHGLVDTACRPHDQFAEKWEEASDTDTFFISTVNVVIHYQRDKDPTKLFESAFERIMRSFFCYGLKTTGEVVAMSPYSWNSDQHDKLSVWSLKGIARLIPGACNKLLALDQKGNLHVAALRATDPNLHLGEKPEWQGLVDVVADDNVILGLKKDGTVVATNNSDYKHWKNIAAFQPGNTHLALTADGLLLAKADYQPKHQEIFQWTELVAFAESKHGCLGLKADGTVVCSYTHTYRERYEALRNVVAIDPQGEFCILADGTVVGGSRDEELYKNLRLFQNIDTVLQERKALWNDKITAQEAKCAEYRAGIAANKGLFHMKERKNFENLLWYAEKDLEMLRSDEHINL